MEVLVESICGLMTKKPIVQVTIDDFRFQLDAADARKIALDLLEAAESSMTDVFLVGFITDRVGADMDRAGQMLLEYRKWRDAQREGIS